MKTSRSDTPSRPEQPEMSEIVDALPHSFFDEASAEGLAQKVVRRMIAALRKMNHPSMLLSGDDSGLKTVWEEICVQRQGEESCDWEAYESTLCILISGTLDELSHEEQVKLWLLTAEGSDWLSDHEEDAERPIPCDNDTEDLLLRRLLSCAEDYSNQRIRSYLKRYGW